ncbi:MAG: hypothetical protein E2O54_07690 [Gammaproteobacteria bacterium]|nr:MAG: hypothetical protein E2O54_07690 [Gammaproteobacteria bacterium]
MLPTDLASFLWGFGVAAIVFILGAWATGFLGEWGKQSFQGVKDWLDPPVPDEILVDHGFGDTLPPGERAWVPKDKRHRRLTEGYSYYLDETHNAKCYREENTGTQYLMVKPGK